MARKGADLLAPPAEDLKLVQRALGMGATLTAKDFARALDISERTVARWKAGDIRPLQPSVRERLKAFTLAEVSKEERTAALLILDELQTKMDELRARLTGRPAPTKVEIDRLR